MQNLNEDERAKFAALAQQWWDGEGPLRTLHDINPCRLAYVAKQHPLAGAAVADIGCGGGLFSEALARAGARVTALDASAELVAVAREHAASANLKIDYQVSTVETFAHDHIAAFDLVVCLELIEHVPDPAALVAACAQLLRPTGVLVISTLNRSAAAYFFGIVLAEYTFNLVPRGTHDYAQFLRPAELAQMARAHALITRDISGMQYNPVTRRAHLCRRPQVNYLASFSRG